MIIGQWPISEGPLGQKRFNGNRLRHFVSWV